MIKKEVLLDYHEFSENLPAIISEKSEKSEFNNEREILYKVLFDMKGDFQ